MKHNVLIVDDSQDDMYIVAAYCLMDADLEPVVARDAGEAFDSLNRKKISVVLADYNLGLGRRTGADLLKEVRERYPHVRRVLVSGGSSWKFEEYVFSGVAELFIHKDRFELELVSTLREMLEI